MATLQEFSKRFSAFGRGIRREIRTFLPRERGRYERIYREAIRTSVYQLPPHKCGSLQLSSTSIRRDSNSHCFGFNTHRVRLIDSSPATLRPQRGFR